MKEIYCHYCQAMPPYHAPCRQSDNGSHKPVVKGEKAYRAKGPDGYTYRFHGSVPAGYIIVEEITY
jgi:hypothetical protein